MTNIDIISLLKVLKNLLSLKSTLTSNLHFTEDPSRPIFRLSYRLPYTQSSSAHLASAVFPPH